jgi:hypothetical protein
LNDKFKGGIKKIDGINMRKNLEKGGKKNRWKKLNNTVGGCKMLRKN